MHKMIPFLMASALTACQSQGVENTADDNFPEATAPVDEPAASQNMSSNSAMPVPTSSLPEPQGPIDPKSSEAAGQVVQHYGALIEEGKFAEAATYWSNPQSAADFAQQLKPYREIHLTIGDLGAQEGAAGSIYITEPVSLYGKTKEGGDFTRRAVVTLRRVNDVPGSSAEQRRWRIQSIQ